MSGDQWPAISEQVSVSVISCQVGVVPITDH